MTLRQKSPSMYKFKGAYYFNNKLNHHLVKYTATDKGGGIHWEVIQKKRKKRKQTSGWSGSQILNVNGGEKPC